MRYRVEGGGSSEIGLGTPIWSAGGATRRWTRRSTSATTTWSPSCVTTTPSTALKTRPRTSRTWRRTWTGCCDGRDGGMGSALTVMWLRCGGGRSEQEERLSGRFRDAASIPAASSLKVPPEWKAPRCLTRCCRFLYRCSCFYFTRSVFTPTPTPHQFSSFVGRRNELPVGFWVNSTVAGQLVGLWNDRNDQSSLWKPWEAERWNRSLKKHRNKVECIFPKYSDWCVCDVYLFMMKCILMCVRASVLLMQ